MIFTCDITEDDRIHDPLLPDPSSFSNPEKDIVSIQFREVEFRMTYIQFYHFVESCNAWIFRGCLDVRDPNDEDYIPDMEHHRLRQIIRTMIDEGKIGRATVPEDVIGAMRLELASFRLEEWKASDRLIFELKTRVSELEDELKGVRPRRRRKT